MAKQEPTPLAAADMEREMGFKPDILSYPDTHVERFYSDLAKVSGDRYERIKREFEEHKRRARKYNAIISQENLPNTEFTHTIGQADDFIILKRGNNACFYNFAVDIQQSFGFKLPLLLTMDEGLETLSVARLSTQVISTSTSPLLRLPKELRDIIYNLVLTSNEWKSREDTDSVGLTFARSLGDPSGFYFPLSNDSILLVSKQVRQEALPIAYRQTFFCLLDIDDLLKFLLAIGRIGRANIQSIQVNWESRSDSECEWVELEDSQVTYLSLPRMHVARCLQMLRQCKNLRLLRLCFERDAILQINPILYQVDPSIQELRSLRGIPKVEIWDFSQESLEQYEVTKMLKDELESPIRED